MKRTPKLPWCASMAAITFVGISIAFAQDHVPPGIRTRQPLTILSANDGQSHRRLDAEGRRDRENVTADSVTVIHLGPDHAPLIKTVYGSVPNSIVGVPYLPVTPNGRYGFVSSRGTGLPRGGTLEPANLLSVIDLASPDLDVVQKIDVPTPGTGAMHPDGKHLVVPHANGLRVFALTGSKLEVVRDNSVPFRLDGVAISPRGDSVVAIEFDPTERVHVFSYTQGRIEHLTEVKIKPGLPPFDGPFAPRFSPDGTRVLVLNGGGNGTKGKLDDVLNIDMRSDPPTVTEAVVQLADGMEGVAFHPSGRMAVIGCLEETSSRAHATYSHLAVIDLTAKPMRLLYEVNIEPIPEGIEFTPDGSQLFVQSTGAHHISVFDVDGFLLRRSPFVIRVGHGPAAMAIAPRFVR